MFAGTNGLLDDLAVADCGPFEQYLYRFLDASHPALLQKIRERKTIDDEIKSGLNGALKEFGQQFVGARAASAAVA